MAGDEAARPQRSPRKGSKGRPTTQARAHGPRTKVGRRYQEAKGLGTFGTIGLEFVAAIAFGLFGGKWLDDRWGTGPWLMILGLAFGMAAGIRAILRAAVSMRSIADREEREQGNPTPKYVVRDDGDPPAERHSPSENRDE